MRECLLAILLLAPKLLLAAGLEGAWQLRSYRLRGDDVPVTGVLLFTPSHFAMVYAMEYQGPSARAHAGKYRLEGGQILFDIPWWVQSVPGEFQVRDGLASAKGAFELSGDSLTIRFEGGSVQVLEKLLSTARDSLTGAWEMESYESSAKTGPATGMVLFQDGHFALVYTMKPTGGLDGRAHAGTFRRRGDAVTLNVSWDIHSIAGKATVAEKPSTREAQVTIAQDGLTLDLGRGSVMKFRRFP